MSPIPQYTRNQLKGKREDIILPGYLYDVNILTELRANSPAYIHGNQVEVQIQLYLKQCSHAFIIARSVNFNHEVLEKVEFITKMILIV